MITSSDKQRYNANKLAEWGKVYDDTEGVSWAGTKEKTLEYFPKKAVLSLFPLLKDGTFGSETESAIIKIKDGRIIAVSETTITGAGSGEPLFVAWLLGPPGVSTFTNDAGYLSLVSTDATLTGDGTLGNPLSVVVGGGGSAWYTGAGAPVGLQTDGDFYLDTVNGDYYEQILGVWVLQGNLTGPAGATGATGATGANGVVPIVTATGTVDVITATYSPVLTLSNLVMCAIVTSGTNTTAVTFSPDGLTVHAIVYNGVALVAGQMPKVAMLEYDLPNTRWELLNPIAIPVVTGYVPYTGATTDVNLGVHSFIANDGTYNTEMSPSYFGVENNAATIFALLEYNKLTLTDNTLPSGLSISATGITFPDLTVQTTAAVTDVTATSPITSSGGATPDISTSMSTNKLIGRGTAGTGVMEEITLGTNLSLTGTTLNSGGGGGLPIATAAGTVDIITATYSPALVLADKLMCAFVASGANTSTTPTFNANATGAKTIVKQGGQALVAGDIPNALAVCILEYNLANTRWELLNPAYGKTATNILKGNFGATWDGQGAVIGTGAWQEITIPYAGTITDWVINSYTPATGVVVSGSIIIELYRSGASIIGGGNKPTLASASTNSAAVAGWTSAAVAAGDKLYAYVSSSPVSCLKVTCTFNITKT